MGPEKWLCHELSKLGLCVDLPVGHLVFVVQGPSVHVFCGHYTRHVVFFEDLCFWICVLACLRSEGLSCLA